MDHLRLLLHFLVLLCIQVALAFNPYEILGVSRQATGQEVKKAYKRLAREWHPDKNSSPDAEAKFVEINKAYEILTDDEKRRNYDQFGTTDENQRPQSQGGFGGFPFSSFFQGGGGRRGGPGGFNGGPFSSFFDSEPDELLINRHVFERDVMPESFKHVYLVYAYSDWCGNCKIVRPMFDQLHKKYKEQGIKFVTADADVDRSLIYKLGISRVPSVLAVVRGKHKLYEEKEWSMTKIEQFLVDKIPKNNLLHLTSKNELNNFIGNIVIENKPRVVLYSESQDPPKWFFTLAFAKQKSHAFAYVSSKDYIDSKTEFLNKNGRISLYISEGQPVELSQQAPSYSLAMKMVENHRLVEFPRISNQVIFDSFCPTVRVISERKYCAILVLPTYSELQTYSNRIALIKKSGLPYAQKTVFAYISPENSQYELLSSLNYSYSSKPQLVTLLRIGERECYYKWLSWNSANSYENVESFLINVVSGRGKLSTSAKFVDINDEEQSYAVVEFVWNTLETINDFIVAIPSWIFWMIHSEDGFIVMSVLVMVLFIFGGSVASAFASVTQVPSSQPRRAAKRTLNKYSAAASRNPHGSDTAPDRKDRHESPNATIQYPRESLRHRRGDTTCQDTFGSSSSTASDDSNSNCFSQ